MQHAISVYFINLPCTFCWDAATLSNNHSNSCLNSNTTRSMIRQTVRDTSHVQSECSTLAQRVAVLTPLGADGFKLLMRSILHDLRAEGMDTWAGDPSNAPHQEFPDPGLPGGLRGCGAR